MAILSTHDLRKLLKLSEERDALVDKLAKLDAEIDSISSRSTGIPASSRKANKTAIAADVKRPKSKKSNSRGSLKQSLLDALAEAGASGISVPDLAKKINVPAKNIHVWFSVTGKKTPSIQKVGRGVYRLIS